MSSFSRIPGLWNTKYKQPSYNGGELYTTTNQAPSQFCVCYYFGQGLTKDHKWTIVGGCWGQRTPNGVRDQENRQGNADGNEQHNVRIYETGKAMMGPNMK